MRLSITVFDGLHLIIRESGSRCAALVSNLLVESIQHQLLRVHCSCQYPEVKQDSLSIGLSCRIKQESSIPCYGHAPSVRSFVTRAHNPRSVDN